MPASVNNNTFLLELLFTETEYKTSFHDKLVYLHLLFAKL